MKPLHTLNTSILLSLLALSVGCAVTTETADSNAAPAAATPAPPAAAPAPDKVDVPIPPDSVLPLLEAEFALRGGQFARALVILSEQIQQLNDPALARRTLRLAEFLRDDRQTLLAAIRLTELDTLDGSAAAKAMSLLTRTGNTDQALLYAQSAKARGARINAPLLVANYQNMSAIERSHLATTIESMAKRWPDDIDIGIAQALLYREMADLEVALALLDTLLLAAPSEERALVLWTQIQLDIESEAPFERIAEAVAQTSDNERLRLQHARLLAANQYYELARAEFEILINSSPRNDEYLMAGALIDLELDRYADATELLKMLIDLEQRLDEAWYYLGRTREESGESSAAVDAYGEVGPAREFPDAKRRAGELVKANEGREQMAAFFAEQQFRYPDQAERLFLIEAELMRDATNDAAIAVYNRALANFPRSISLLYGRAMIFEATGDIPAMEADMRTILEDNPDNATTLNALGYTLTNHTNRYEEAAALIERALQLSPNEPAMLDSLGWVYFKMGRLVEAESILREAYTLLPDPEVAAHLGEALWAQGKHLEARDVWRDGLDADAENTHILATIDRLGVELD